ncbi:AraC family transcriptional regulator [Streptacidiphilus jiangxiensis]|uniref:AraC-type DNA-binding protein n=1 Tax=Streptacidiphilus jiangxiensis TaxID=235985 RepID=A0A1H7XAA4_STRJI|nr:helix-turn-helix domain-containing protein [Streptacidiphilus jiangxiensis]SEM30736.1 AraC-type DNA-binding protein [Streptacidiphilus jiangxiensis]
MASAAVVEVVDEAVRGVPAPPLRGLVGWYSGYRQRGVAPTRHRGLPSPYLTLILTLDEPLTVAAHPDAHDAPGDYVTLLGGLHTSPALIEVPGRQSGVQVALGPLGARALLGLPAGGLAGVDLHADDVLGADARRAQERLREATDWPGRFRVLDAWLLGRLRAAEVPPDPPPEVGEAWRLLLASRGLVRVAALADEVGWSERHLRSRFLAEIGLTPKAAARVVRFDVARRRLATRPDAPDLAGLAADHGYADQSHLDREFTALAGCAPSAWLAEEFRNIQAGHHAPA